MATTKKLPASFEELIQTSDLPVLVDFWAEWCGPCRMMEPVLKQLAKDMKGRIRVVKVNVDEKPHIAQRYQIQGIPTTILFYKGQPIWRKSGAMPLPMLKQEIERHLPT